MAQSTKIIYDDAYSEKYRKHAVNTKLRTLLDLRVIFKQIGLEDLLKEGKADTKQMVSGVLNALAEKNLINEFCQTTTGNKEQNFNDCEFGEVAWVIHDFFVAYWWQMPPSWRGSIKKSVGVLQELGKAFLPIAPKPEAGEESPPG